MAYLHAFALCLSLVLLYGGVQFSRRAGGSLLAVLLWLSSGAVLLVATVADLVAAGRLAAALDPLLGGLSAGQSRLLFAFVVGALVFAVLHLYAAVRSGARRIAQLHQEIALLRHEVERLRDDEPASGRRESRERLDD